jgi:putative endonuclease
MPRRAQEASRALGALGERLACEHLERLGFAVLERNVRTRRGEIDVIAFDGETLVFAEVKTVRAPAAPPAPVSFRTPVGPLERLGRRQQLRLRRLAAAWLCERRPRPHARTIRLDAIGVIVDGSARLLRLDHLEAAF